MSSSLRAELALHRGAFSLDLRLEVGAGERLAIVGPSGAGKSTALRAIAGLERATGRVELGDRRWLDTDAGVDLDVERRRVGYVFQEYALFPTMSAWRNVAFGIRGADRSARRARALDLLDRFGLRDRAEARPGGLSGGERQRVALARAIASDPALLLLDEPLSALDAQTRGRASSVLTEVLDEAEAPALIVTHDFTEAALLADRIVVLAGGRVVQRGTAAELAASPASSFVADLTGAVVLRGVARPAEAGLTLVELAGGGTLTSTDAASGPVAASVFPWEIEIGPRSESTGSALNHLAVVVSSVSEFGNRARVGLLSPQPLAAEVTSASVERLGLVPGAEVEATWKATATRLTPT